MIMRPPQRGHGGSQSEGSGASTGSVGGATASSSPARAYFGLAGGAGEQAVVADAVEAMWQDMEKEAADELVRRERHDALPLRTIAAVVFVAEGDAGLVERKQALVRESDPMGVAREIGEHGLRAGERRLGVDHPPLLPDRSKMTQERAVVGETGL